MIHLFALICSMCWFNFGEAGHVIVTCERNCNVTGTQINGGEGDDIALKYIVTTKDFFSVQISHITKTKLLVVIVTLSENGLLMINRDRPDFVWFNDTKSHKRDDGYEFSFEVLQFNRTLQDTELYSRITFKNGSGSDSRRALNILYGPKMITDWIPTYRVEEYSSEQIIFKLSGNPKPDVRAQMGGKTFNITSSSGPSIYEYDISVVNISRNQCGKYLFMKAIGFKQLDRYSKFNVTFIPDIPSDLSVSHVNSSCVELKWKKIQSGNCPVLYTLSSEFTALNNHSKTVTSFTNLTMIPLRFPSFNSSYNVTFRVKAEVGGQASNFSEPLIVPIVPPTLPPPTTHRPTTTVVRTTATLPTRTSATTATTPKTTSLTETTTPSSHTSSTPPLRSGPTTIIIIVVAVVLLVTIVVIIFLVRKGRLKCPYCHNISKNNNNNNNNGDVTIQSVSLGAVNAAVESDYADIGSVQPQSQQPIQETDYAELGPGGRVGTRPAPVEQSLYAQVNTDSAYYPSLKPQVPSTSTPETEYAAVSTTAVRPKSVKSPANEPEYAVSSKSKTAPPQPPGQQGKRTSKKAKAPNPPEPEYAVSTKRAGNSESVDEASTYI